VRGLIAVGGSLAQKPHQAGHTWVFLQYLLGFRRLGYDVLVLDRLEPGMCTDAAGRPCSLDDSTALRYFLDVTRRFGLGESFSLAYDGGQRVVGLPRHEVLERVRRSALFLNFMGFVNDPEVLAAAPRRVFFDFDPGFGQMWRALGLADPFAGHDAFVTVGERVGQPGCTIPDCGLTWVTTPQPVVLEQWPAAPPRPDGAFTSIGAWRGPYGPIEYGGRTYGLRVHEFRRFLELPGVTGERFEVALDIDAAETRDLAALHDNGWSLADPRRVAADPAAYQAYLRGSKAEFLVAKNLYVQSASGWFSDRSICYLATGRPVLAQDTGVRDLYPTGEGLLVYSTPEEAADGVAAINADYERHCRAARRLAEDRFDSDVVLPRLLSKLGVA
jgi:hypothetical protein